jgi:carbon-monoxide dehydrogenase medium subunit
MSGFDLVHPKSMQDALAQLDTEDETVRAFSGGTALMLMMKAGVFQPSKLVNLDGLETTHSNIEVSANGELRIGAMATLASLEHSSVVASHAPVIVSMMARLANVRVRNVARVGGCLAHGDPHMDLPPVLAALGAEAVLVSITGERRVPVECFFTGYYETVLNPGELIAAVNVPPQSGWSSVYLKMTTRSADDWPALAIAVSIRLEGKVIAESRMIVSAATEKLTRLPSAEAVLCGQLADAECFAKASEAAAAEAETISDSRGSAAYKSQLLRVQLRRALEQATREGQKS